MINQFLLPQVAVNESTETIQENPWRSRPQNWEEELPVGALLRSRSQRDRRTDPYAQDGEDHTQICASVSKTGVGNAYPADYEKHAAGWVDDHARLSVGWEGPWKLWGETWEMELVN